MLLASVGDWVKRIVILLLLLITVSLVGYPYYNVWEQELSGKAILAKAEYSRKADIEQAKAKSQSATYEAEAEVKRARGVSEANAIIADGLGGANGYLTYLKIQALSSDSCQKIYIPTEAGLPILEARNAK